MAAVVVTPAVSSNQTNLEKIESFINDSAYKELLENSVNYNTRLCIERRLRLPFIDTQTGVAQNHCALFMHKRQRIPGLQPGQIYCYPRQRWRKKRRQYLTMNSRAFARAADAALEGEMDMHSISQIENPALQDTDSKDSQLYKDEAKDWYYDEQDMLDMDTYDEPDQDSDLDYEETYIKRGNRRKKGNTRGRNEASTPGRRKGSGRGRKKTGGHSFEPTPGDPDKPFACELCGARYKTRPGLTYHYGHSHKEGASDENSRESCAASAPPAVAGGGGSAEAPVLNPQGSPIPGHVYQDSYVSFLNQPPGTPRRGRNNPPGPPQPPMGPQAPPPVVQMPPMQQAPPTLPPNLPPQPVAPMDDPPMPILMPEKALEPPPIMEPAAVAAMMPPHPHQHPMQLPHPNQHPMHPQEKKVSASPYCDFCLGDSTQNKKTGGMEELVSCSDCGRSGHPTCLQFTANMKVSVKKYRWQCIECKCCSVCGNSDNDDQLLFCDDCDRGYHMYCLSPPLVNPPEGSWSCQLCIEEFHK